MVDNTDAGAPAKGRRRKADSEAPIAAAPAAEAKPVRSRRKTADAAPEAAPAAAAETKPRTRRKSSDAPAAEAAPATAPVSAPERPAAERPAPRGDRSGFAEQQGPPRGDNFDPNDPNRKRRRRGGRGRKRSEGDAPPGAPAPRDQQPREYQPREYQPREQQPRDYQQPRQGQGPGRGRNDQRGGRNDGRGPGGPGGLRDPRAPRGDQRGRPDQRGGRSDGPRGGGDYRGRDGGGDYRGRDGGGAGRGRPAGGGAPLERSVPKGQLPAELIYGINAVSVAIETGQLKVLYYDNGYNNERVKQIHAHALDANITVLPLARQGWSRALSGEQHQGVAGMLYPQTSHFLEEIVANAGDDSCILVLDRVQDPQNLGAILRTSGAAGVDAVVLPKAGGCPVTPAVHRAAAGVSLLNRIVEDENIARALDFLKDNGYWVIGCDSEEGEDATTFEFPEKRVIVMGNEAEGMRRLVKEHCDYLVRIPMPGPRWLAAQHSDSSTAMVESLNVSVATAIILYLSMSDLARAAHEASGDDGDEGGEVEPTEEG